jgi:hypothetical protein
VRAVENEWEKTREEIFRVLLWEETKETNMAVAEHLIEAKHAFDCATHYESDWQDGREHGFKQGQMNTLRDFQAQLDEAQAMEYDAGIAAETKAQAALE